MKRFYVTGARGSYCELSSGDFADTVSGMGDITALFAVDAEDVVEPLLTNWSALEVAYYVGALETLTAEQCAQLAHVGRRAINRSITAGHLAARRFGNAWQIDVAEFEAWLAWRGRRNMKLLPSRRPGEERRTDYGRE